MHTWMSAYVDECKSVLVYWCEISNKGINSIRGGSGKRGRSGKRGA